MVWFLSVGIDCLSSVIFILPAVIILQCISSRQHDFKKTFMVFLFASYSMAVFSVTGIPAFNTLRIDCSFNLIPLADIVNNPSDYIRNTVLNIILFMPMGFLLPAIWKEYRSAKETVFTGFAVSAAIELLQIFTFRLTDVDDLITNTSGTFLGYYCGKIYSFKLPFKLPSDLSANADAVSAKYEPVIILAAVFLIAFFLKPFVSDALWDIVLSSS